MSLPTWNVAIEHSTYTLSACANTPYYVSILLTSLLMVIKRALSPDQFHDADIVIENFHANIDLSYSCEEDS